MIDLWDELDLAEPIREAWTPLIAANRQAPAKTDAYFRHEEIRPDSIEIVTYPDER